MKGEKMGLSMIEVLMRSAEQRQRHVAKHKRPHIAQEYEDRGARADAESCTYALMPHARRRAKGEKDASRARRSTRRTIDP